jgi:hypothetical protein
VSLFTRRDANQVGSLYGLTVMSPIKTDSPDSVDQSVASSLRDTLAAIAVDHTSPFAMVPNVYFARFYVLKDVFYESKPAREEHLKSQYLVFMCDFHGKRDQLTSGLWNEANTLVRDVWKHCVGFGSVDSVDDFESYIKKCQIKNALVFNGSTDQPLAEQLKGLYLKQEFGRFVATHQGLAPADLRAEFRKFVERVRPEDLLSQTWRPGAISLDGVEVTG